MSARIRLRRQASKRRLAPTIGGTSSQPGWCRLVASVAAALLLPATAPGIGAFACHHHSDHAGTAAGHEAQHQVGPGKHDAHPVHPGQRHHAGTGSPEANHNGHGDGDSQSCTCAGWCPASGTPPSPATDQGRDNDPAWTRVAQVAAPSDGPLQPHLVPHLLPFANPPPSS